MDELNNSENEIYKTALKRNNSIDKKLEKTKIRELSTDLQLIGTKNDILIHIKGGPSKNLINAFFKSENVCDYCGIEKSKTIQLDRAHCNKDKCDRVSLLEIAINKHFINEFTPIKIKDILRTFIKLHNEIPLFTLCKKCHQTYDK
jgi:hypothetical protein